MPQWQEHLLLVILVIFADNVVRQPGNDHLRARDSHQANDLVERLTVTPLFEGMENIGARSIGPVQKPGIRNAVGSQ
jgi:hypothetical protein